MCFVQLVLILLTVVFGAQRADAGLFSEKPIFLDTQVSGQPPANDGRRTFPVLSKDDRVLIEVFVGGLARGLTSGFTLAFVDDNLAFSMNFEIEKFEGVLTLSLIHI